MIIRDAHLLDIKLLSEMAISTFVKTYVALNPENAELLEAYANESFSEIKIESEIQKGHIRYYLMIHDNLHVGYAKTVQDGAKLELEKLYLTGVTQGMGLGQKFFEHILIKAREQKIKNLWLNVYDQNQGAIKFYSRLGFRKVGERDFKYVWNGQNYKDNDWVMEYDVV